jgi:hypothetical protein
MHVSAAQAIRDRGEPGCEGGGGAEGARDGDLSGGREPKPLFEKSAVVPTVAPRIIARLCSTNIRARQEWRGAVCVASASEAERRERLVLSLTLFCLRRRRRRVKRVVAARDACLNGLSLGEGAGGAGGLRGVVKSGRAWVHN